MEDDVRLVLKGATKGGRYSIEVFDTEDKSYRFKIVRDDSVDYCDDTDEMLAMLFFDIFSGITYDNILVDEFGVGKEYLEIVRLFKKKYSWLEKPPKGSEGRTFYFDIIKFVKSKLMKGVFIDEIFRKVDEVLSNKNI